MKIITINIPQSYIDAINALIGDGGIYPSRSELIRVAIRDFLINELEVCKAFTKLQDTVIGESTDDGMSVLVPVDDSGEYKNYRIVKK